MDARAHEAIAVPTFQDIPECFKRGVFGKSFKAIRLLAFP